MSGKLLRRLGMVQAPGVKMLLLENVKARIAKRVPVCTPDGVLHATYGVAALLQYASIDPVLP